MSASPNPEHDLACLLSRAIREEHKADIARLLAAGADPDGRDQMGICPLHHAYAQPETIGLLLAAGADPNVIFKHSSPLYPATVKGQFEVMDLLMSAGADPFHRGWRGNTLLHSCALRGRGREVRWLLAAGVDPSTPCDNGRSPLDLVGSRGDHTFLRDVLTRDPRTRLTPSDFHFRQNHGAYADVFWRRQAASDMTALGALAREGTFLLHPRLPGPDQGCGRRRTCTQDHEPGQEPGRDRKQARGQIPDPDQNREEDNDHNLELVGDQSAGQEKAALQLLRLLRLLGAMPPRFRAPVALRGAGLRTAALTDARVRASRGHLLKKARV